MIGMLKGLVELRSDPYLIIDVQGVGYKVLVSHAVLAKAETGSEIKVYTHTHVREDILELYGFTDPGDLKLFEYLIGVSGVGCKSAMGVFSVGNRSTILHALAANDVAFFMAVPRLGKKNAQKIIIELKNKLGGPEDLDLAAENEEGASEVLAALQGFGFSSSEAQRALQAVRDQGGTTSEKLKLALKYLGK